MSSQSTDPVADAASPVQKPGFKTSEGIGAAVVIVSAIASVLLDILPPDSKWIGLVGAVATVCAYVIQRGLVKMSGNKAAALVAASKPTDPS